MQRDGIKKLAIQTSQRQIEKNRKTFDLLTDEFTELRELIEQDSCDEQDSERFEQVKHELKLKEENKHEGNRIRAKIEKFHNDEKQTKYYFKKEQKRGETKQINILIDSNEETIEDKDDIIEEIENFYGDLYKTEHHNVKQAIENLKFIKDRLSKSDNEVLNDEITEMEIKKAIWRMKNEKSPGEDGLPREFYHKYFHLLKEEMSELFNNIKLDKQQPESQKNALIKLLYKKGDHRNLKNWRPVSLLNVDYKILTKILTNRLSNFLHKIVPEEQKCGVKGRKMNDVIRNLASYRDHSESGF